MDIVMARTATILDVSRRALLALVSVVPASRLPSMAPAISDFDLGWVEHLRVREVLSGTPEAEEDKRNALLDRWAELEALVLETPCTSTPAIRAKARMLLLYMDMQGHEFLPAMREIHDFVERST
jgi:hypothetical protein